MIKIILGVISRGILIALFLTMGARAEIIETRVGELDFSHDFINGIPTKETAQKLFDEMDFQRATQAYIWGLGPVSMLQWQRDAAEKFGAGNFDIVRYDSYSDKLGILTANATTP